MANVIQFVPKSSKTAEENLNEFIRLCKEDLTVFGSTLNFDSNEWDVTDYIHLKGKRNLTKTIAFGFYESGSRSTLIPLDENVLLLAKAYVRYMYAFRPIMSNGARVVPFKALGYALNGQPIALLNPDKFNRAAQWVVQNYSESAAYRMGAQLECLHKFLVKKRLLANPFKWVNPIKRPSDTQRVGKEADDRRLAKMPSQAALDAIPKIFRMATSPRDALISSVVAILCAAPERISELLELPVDCEVIQKNPDGSIHYGLRWWPAKGAAPQIKWVVPTMVEVVQEAIKRIRKITDSAREVAIWYEQNPGMIFLGNDCERFRGRQTLKNSEVATILGVSFNSSGISNFLEIDPPAIKYDGKFRRASHGEYEFVKIEEAVLKKLPIGFPYLDKEKRFKYSNSLFLVRKNELDAAKGAYKCLIHPLNSNMINESLGSRVEFNFDSIFTSNNFYELDGSPIRVSTHQFRHYLNTLAQAGGMSQLDIAKWSGRKDVRQNAAYDHVSSKEMVQIIRGAIGDQVKAHGPLAHLQGKSLIPRDEFARLVIPTAHVTDLGFCIHDYTMAPCEIHRDCINCQEMVCVKGDRVAERNIKAALDESLRLLKDADLAASEGAYGAGRWLEHHRGNHERLLQLDEILSNSLVPEGTVIQLAKSKRAIEAERKKLINGGGNDNKN
ncbi:integrase [Polynucleobacter sp. JS-Safj-400b-B2]|nr:integrase [Polynucleobacter sp. JS-Safj-400b-B2]